MKFKTLVMTLCALAAFTVTSCKDEPDPTPTPTPDAATITVTPTSLSFDAAGAAKDLTVKSNADWTVTVPADASWLTVSAKSGSKDGSVKVTAAANAGAAGAAAAAREAKLTFAVEGKKVDVVVSQAAEAIVFVVDGDTAVVPATGGQVAVKVEYNEAYTVGTLPEWITAGTKATKTDNLSFAVAANEATTERSADITFTSASGKTGKVTVKQAAAEVKVKSLSTAQDLVDFAELCRKAFVSGASQADTLAVQAYDADGDGVYTLEADIDMNGIAWVPFNFPFNFDGKNHRIYNLVCENAEGNAGFIGTLSPDASCKNLCVGSKDYDFATKKGTYDGVSKIVMAYKGELITSYYYSGVIGYSHKNTTLDNIVNFAAISSADGVQSNVRIGGIAGTLKAGVTVTNCLNFGTVTIYSNSSATSTLGGISGFMDGDGCLIKGCENHGAVTCYTLGSKATYIGGITASPNAYAGDIEDCNNYGEVNEAVCPGYQSYIGGITAFAKTTDASKVFNIKNCNNYGKVHYSAPTSTVAMLIGGIIGSAEQIAGGIENCVNEGEVVFEAGSASTADVVVGGIAGRQVTKPVPFTNCVNKGKVSVTSEAPTVSIGGVLGRSHQGTILTSCSNEGEILFSGKATTAVYEGGFIGYSQSTVFQMVKCSNKGTVKSTGEAAGNYCGSLIGYINKNVPKNTLMTECNALGTVSCSQNSANAFVGGLLGYAEAGAGSAMIAEKCTVDCVLESAVAATSTNSANVAENAGLVIGGFQGQEAGNVYTFGTAEEPIKVMGKVNNVTVTDGELSVATSYKNYLTGNGSLNSVAGGSADQVINAVFADAKPATDIPGVDYNNPGVTL